MPTAKDLLNTALETLCDVDRITDVMVAPSRGDDPEELNKSAKLLMQVVEQILDRLIAMDASDEGGILEVHLASCARRYRRMAEVYHA